MSAADPNWLFTAGVRLLVLLLGISIHESAHALASLRAGDPTAAESGRISLNPIRHIDLLGSLIVPLVLLFSGGPIFGWGKPAPVNVGKLANPNTDHLRVVLAGPLANLLVGGVALVALAATIGGVGPGAAETAAMCLMGDVEGASRGAGFPVLYTLVQFAFLNGFLGVFNMVPVPPLDGGQVVLQLLPREWARKFSAIQPYGFMIVLALAALNILSVIVLPVFLVVLLIIQISG